VGVVDRADAHVAARLVVAFGRPAQRIASVLVGDLYLRSVKCGEETAEGLGFTDRCLLVFQRFGMGEVQLQPGEPTSSSVRRISVWAGGKSTGMTRGPA
jgi:hypothetical protein